MEDLKSRLDAAEELHRMETDAMAAIANYMRQIVKLSATGESAGPIAFSQTDYQPAIGNGTVVRKRQEADADFDSPIIKRQKDDSQTSSPEKATTKYVKKENESDTDHAGRLILTYGKDDVKGVAEVITSLKLSMGELIDTILDYMDKTDDVSYSVLSEILLESGNSDDVLKTLLDWMQRLLVRPLSSESDFVCIYTAFSNLAGLCCAVGKTAVCEVVCFDTFCLFASLLTGNPLPANTNSVFRASAAAAAGILSKYTIPYDRSWAFCAHLILKDLAESETEVVKVHTAGCQNFLSELSEILFLPKLETDYISIKTRVLGRLLERRGNCNRKLQSDAILTIGLCGARFGFDFCHTTRNSKLVSDVVDVMSARGRLDQTSVSVVRMLSSLYLVFVSHHSLLPHQKKEVADLALQILQNCDDDTARDAALFTYLTVSDSKQNLGDVAIQVSVITYN